MMKHKIGALILLAGLSWSGVHANAQGGPGQRGGGRAGRGQGAPMMTPQQMQTMREAALKMQMTELGVVETAQTAILSYAQTRETATMPLRVQARALQMGLNNNLGAEAATRQLTALRAAIKTEKERRTTAEKELDAAVGFAKNPQLEAFLVLSGLVGDEGAILAPPASGGRGFGGGRGNWQGGPPRGGPEQGGPGPEPGPGPEKVDDNRPA